MNVPFLDLKQQYQFLREEILTATDKIYSEASFILGPAVSKFEQEFAAFLGSRHCIAVSSGTDALHLAYRALDIGPGDEVLLPAHTFVATAIGIISAGAKPVLVDINPETFLIDLKLAEKAVTSRTKAICPVHLYGRCCNLSALREFADKHNLLIIEDAAQSHGAKWSGVNSGTAGIAGCFSFYPGKNLGAYGDGGALVTNSDEVAAKMRALRNYGSEVKYHHPLLGWNYRLDSVQAAVLSAKLPHLEGWNHKRWKAAELYNSLLEGKAKDLNLPELTSSSEHVFHLYVIQHPERDRLQKVLSENGIQTGIHYPIPYHLQGGYSSLGYRQGDFPITEKIANNILSLPMFPEITEEQVRYVCQVLLNNC